MKRKKKSFVCYSLERQKNLLSNKEFDIRFILEILPMEYPFAIGDRDDEACPFRIAIFFFSLILRIFFSLLSRFFDLSLFPFSSLEASTSSTSLSPDLVLLKLLMVTYKANQIKVQKSPERPSSNLSLKVTNKSKIIVRLSQLSSESGLDTLYSKSSEKRLIGERFFWENSQSLVTLYYSRLALNSKAETKYTGRPLKDPSRLFFVLSPITGQICP